MDSGQKQTAVGKPGYMDYVRAAFNLRVKVPGFGGLPLNWLYLALVAGASAAFWPVGLVGAAAEIGYLATLAESASFRRAVRARFQQRRGEDVEDGVKEVVASLPPTYRAKYEAFYQKCEDVLEIAGHIGTVADAALQTYDTYLAQLREVYARMLNMVATFARYSADWAKTDPAPEIAAIEKELADGKLTDAVKASRTSTLDILKQRAQSRKDIIERVKVMESEIERLEQRLSLLRDQALLTRDPSALSSSMDQAAAILEDHTSWLKENSVLLQGLENSPAGQ